MSASTANGSYVLTKCELIEMLAPFDDSERIRIVWPGKDTDGDDATFASPVIGAKRMSTDVYCGRIEFVGITFDSEDRNEV